MINFEFISPTKIYFGKDVVDNNLSKELKERKYQRCLLVYGKSSIFKMGLYDKVINILKDDNIQCWELGGVEANPKIELVRKGVEIIDKHDIDIILAVGGGSVIDTAKLIGVSKDIDFDPFEFNLGNKKPSKSIDVFTILTISAAGSELSNSCVISNDELKLKRGFNSDLIRPKVSFLDPTLTYSVSKYQTACGIVDILMHTLERYIVLDESEITHNMAEGLMRTVIQMGPIAYNDPTNYDARSNLMLASSLSHNGLTSLGVKMFFTVHKLEHELSGFYPEVAHGAGLAILWPAWARYVVNKFPEKFAKLAHNVLNIEKTDDLLFDALKGIDYLEKFFKSIGMPTRLRDLNIDSFDYDGMALSATSNKTKKVLGIIDLDYNDIVNIYKMSY